MDVVVTGIGLVSALGSLEATWQRLLLSKTGIRQCQPFADLQPQPLGMIGQRSIELENLTQRVVTAALRDADLAAPLLDCAVVIGSSRGQQAQWERVRYEERYEARGKRHEAKGERETWRHGDITYSVLSPQHSALITWLNTLPHAAAMTTARLIGTGAAVRSPMAACATGLWAIAQGYELVRSGEYERVIAGAVEAPITPLTLTGFERMGALAQTGVYPFDRDREGLVLAEGGAVFVLESAELAKQRFARVYGQILGFGLTADAHHVSAPELEGRAAIAAVTGCLQRSRLTPIDIDYIHAHGTGTKLNDRNEAGLIQTVFPAGVPVSSTKGATGHTIGASGALGVAFCLLALQHQLLPPTVGLRQPEFDLNFVTAPRSARLETALCLGFGFGGQNAAIALSIR